jgi:hypothetical protein
MLYKDQFPEGPCGPDKGGQMDDRDRYIIPPKGQKLSRLEVFFFYRFPNSGAGYWLEEGY